VKLLAIEQVFGTLVIVIEHLYVAHMFPEQTFRVKDRCFGGAVGFHRRCHTPTTGCMR